jgi:hypothetical protein
MKDQLVVDSEQTSVRDFAVMKESSTPIRSFLLRLVLLAVLSLQGCSGALFKVKPLVDLPAMPENSSTAEGGGIKLRAALLLRDEESQELFEANLPIAGILPVRMEFVYESGVPIEIKRARFRLRDADGREWKLLSAKKATSQIMKANGIFAYNPNSRKQFEKEFGAYELDHVTPLNPAERRRQGFLFFQSPNKQPVESPRGLTLVIERLPQPVEIKLN